MEINIKYSPPTFNLLNIHIVIPVKDVYFQQKKSDLVHIILYVTLIIENILQISF